MPGTFLDIVDSTKVDDIKLIKLGALSSIKKKYTKKPRHEHMKELKQFWNNTHSSVAMTQRNGPSRSFLISLEFVSGSQTYFCTGFLSNNDNKKDRNSFAAKHARCVVGGLLLKMHVLLVFQR